MTLDCYKSPQYSYLAVQRSCHRCGLLKLPRWYSMVKIILNKIAKIVIVAVKSYCRILTLVVMVTVWWSYSVVTKAVAVVNDYWLAVTLISVICSSILIQSFQNYLSLEHKIWAIWLVREEWIFPAFFYIGNKT